MTALSYAVIAIVAALGAAAVVGLLVTRRSGVLRETSPAESAAPVDVSGLGLSGTGPTIVHFGAVWCGPCAGVRLVVDQVCAERPGVAHVEIDVDADPVAARRLSVLSLPTTVVFDVDGRARYRTVGVPKAADLRRALAPLLA